MTIKNLTLFFSAGHYEISGMVRAGGILYWFTDFNVSIDESVKFNTQAFMQLNGGSKPIEHDSTVVLQQEEISAMDLFTFTD